MLLRRITEHVKAQNWTAVALDFFIVVVGVFMGIQLGNWNEARGERTEEAGFLLALEEDVKESVDEIDEVIALSNTQETARKALYDYSLGELESLDLEKFSELIENSLWSFPSVELRQTTFDTLRSSGRLGLFADKKLVVALQELAALIEEAETEKQHELYALERFGDPLLYAHVDLAKVFQNEGLVVEGARVPWIEKTSPELEIPDMAKSQQFRNAVLMRSALTNERMGTYELLRQKYVEIQTRIDARQKTLGVE